MVVNQTWSNVVTATSIERPSSEENFNMAAFLSPPYCLCHRLMLLKIVINDFSLVFFFLPFLFCNSTRICIKNKKYLLSVHPLQENLAVPLVLVHPGKKRKFHVDNPQSLKETYRRNNSIFCCLSSVHNAVKKKNTFHVNLSVKRKRTITLRKTLQIFDKRKCFCTYPVSFFTRQSGEPIKASVTLFQNDKTVNPQHHKCAIAPFLNPKCKYIAQ